MDFFALADFLVSELRHVFASLVSFTRDPVREQVHPRTGNVIWSTAYINYLPNMYAEPFVLYLRVLDHDTNDTRHILVARSLVPGIDVGGFFPTSERVEYHSYKRPIGLALAPRFPGQTVEVEMSRMARGYVSGKRRFTIVERDLFRPVVTNVVSDDWDLTRNEISWQSNGATDSTFIASIRDILAREKSPRVVPLAQKQREPLRRFEIRDVPIADEDQTRVFSTPLNKTLVIEGSPGTGKTTVAIKRLSQKTDDRFLTQAELGGASLSLWENPNMWALFVPDPILIGFVEASLQKESISISREQMTAWPDFKRRLVRTHLDVPQCESGVPRMPLRIEEELQSSLVMFLHQSMVDHAERAWTDAEQITRKATGEISEFLRLQDKLPSPSVLSQISELLRLEQVGTMKMEKTDRDKEIEKEIGEIKFRYLLSQYLQDVEAGGSVAVPPAPEKRPGGKQSFRRRIATMLARRRSGESPGLANKARLSSGNSVQDALLGLFTRSSVESWVALLEFLERIDAGVQILPRLPAVLSLHRRALAILLEEEQKDPDVSLSAVDQTALQFCESVAALTQRRQLFMKRLGEVGGSAHEVVRALAESARLAMRLEDEARGLSGLRASRLLGEGKPLLRLVCTGALDSALRTTKALDWVGLAKAIDRCMKEACNLEGWRDAAVNIWLYVRLYLSRQCCLDHGKETGSRVHQFYRPLWEEMRPIIVVDEATDFSAMDLACMESLTHPRTRCFTMTGDLMQRTTPYGLRSWEELRALGVEYDLHVLRKVYRQSPAILKVASRLYHQSTGHDPPYISGWASKNKVPLPLAAHCRSAASCVQWLSERVHEIARASDGIPSTAVFYHPACTDIHNISAGLSSMLTAVHVKLVSPDEHVSVPEGSVGFYDIRQIKGLEFEAAFFLDVDRLEEVMPELYDHYIYVGVTRAAFFLGLTYQTRLPTKLAACEDLLGRDNWAQFDPSPGDQ